MVMMMMMMICLAPANVIAPPPPAVAAVRRCVESSGDGEGGCRTERSRAEQSRAEQNSLTRKVEDQSRLLPGLGFSSASGVFRIRRNKNMNGFNVFTRESTSNH